MRTYEHDPAETDFGAEAAQKLGVPAERVYKTLLADLDGALVVGVVPVSARLGLKALAAALGGKRAAMADPALAERRTGYVVGGISPLGQKTRHRTVINAAAAQHPTILVSGGRRGLDLELAPSDLAAATGAIFAAISRG